MITRFVFVVRTAAPAESIAFYRDVLGGEVEKSDERTTLVVLGPGCVEILTSKETSAAGMIAFDVDDLDGMLARVRDGGATITYGPIDVGNGHRAFGTTDPDGVSVNFVGD